MEECESLDSEMTELQEFQSEAPGAVGQDDEDEVEELRNSLREVVQDQSVRPKLQCLMVDPSFSMVTVQSEDSGIVWETASSRCSTPWASETSSISEAYSMEGSGAQGKITIIFDEDKVVRRRTRSGGRSSRLGDRLSRPGSSRSGSALGVERPEMAEVSIPNVKQEKTETGPDLEEIKDKDQQLFSLISEGYEILNIRVPSKLPTVDEEESTELQDNLSYLDQTPGIRSRNHQGLAKPQNHVLPGEMEVEILEHKEGSKQDSSQPLAVTEVGHTDAQKDGTTDMDYFEKFTLVDEVTPGEQAPELQDEVKQPVPKPQVEEQKPVKETVTDSPHTSEDSFVFVTDVEIAGEHLDEVFYGNGVHGAPDDAQQHKEEDEEEEEAGKRVRRESQRSLKESGSVLFGSEETILTPIFLSSGPPKIIDPILLEEPTAMSFMYSDLYEDAVGERRKSDEEYSEAESMASERSFRRRLSDPEEQDGYLEMFILKDETPTVEVQPDSEEDKTEGRMMWSQSKFEMTGCLTRVVEEEEEEKEEEGMKKKELTPQEVSDVEMSVHAQSAKIKVKEKTVIETDKKKEEKHPTMASDQQDVLIRRPSEESMQASKPQDKVKKQQTKSCGSDCDEQVSVPEMQHMDIKIEKTQREKHHQREQPAAKMCEPGITETQQPSQTESIMEKTAEVVVKATEERPAEVKAPITSEVPKIDAVEDTHKVEVKDTEKNLSEESALNSEIVATNQKVEKVNVMVLAKAELPAKMKDPETVRQEMAICIEPSVRTEISAEGLVSGKTEVDMPEKAVVIATDCEPAVQAVAEVMEEEVAEFQVKIASQGVTNAETPKVQTEVPEEEKGQEVLIEEIVVDSPLPQSMTEAVDAGQESEVKTEILPKILEPVMPEKTEPDADKKQLEVRGSDQSQQKESVSEKEAGTDELTAEIKAKTDSEAVVQQTVNEGGELIVLVPKGQAVEMDIEIGIEEAEEEEQKIERDFEEDEGVFSRLRSFTPQEDLSEVAEHPEVTAEELEYEIISKQEAREISEPERAAEEPLPESVLDLPSGEELIEADYDIIDAEEEIQARAAAELQGMDWFCVTCGCLLSEEDCMSGQHQEHEVTSVDSAYEDIKEKLSEWISELQGRSENIEDLVSELELAYNSVEDQCAEREEAMQAQNEEMMAKVMDQYNSMSLSMEEEKKAKLEQLYDQIVSFQESIDSAKGTLETTAREAETDARSPEDIDARLKAALESAMSLELGPRGLLVFEDYAKGNTSNSHLAQREGIPVPQKPTLQAQEQGSATTTSVTVYWRVNPGDIIDCFQVYCMEDPQGAVSEEYRVTVKESYCVLEELEPDKTYKVWVMAVNYTGCSLPSERLAFRTAPSVPVIDTERCTVLWDSAMLRWSSAKQTSAQSYTLEYCRQYELEGEGLRSISGIKGSEQKVLLQPNENYLFYIKAVNEAGASEQSEAALISTKGTRFHLLKSSAHPCLELSEDQTTVHYSQDTHDNTPPTENQCPSILGELLPARGHYYWETKVTGSPAYRLGVAYSSANRNSPLGDNNKSWCLHCIPTQSSCTYQLLHNDVQSDVFAMDLPERVGTLLDYQLGRLSFYNAQSGQLLGSLSHCFTQPCHPALGLEMPGSLEVSMVLEVPEFTKYG
ncbi:cardiomyopathy-associated protein 5 [Myripristis murdjan]|uniref:cardiomyopathy-associated protein 5 n=1 Tax=Myripristis murdjan TaxID=586833 RepID=UPI0011764999|nr:cardiomyopathy-associated protein 5-like [Myripristis murdjan]